MAELVLSALLSVLFEKLADAAVKKIARNNGIDADIKKWKRLLIQIQGVLNDASRKVITNESVKRWLNNLQHLAYDIDDVLDDLATEAMHHEYTHNSEASSSSSKVRMLIPTCCTNFSRDTKMHEKLDDITTILEDLVKEKTDLGLRVEEGSTPINRNRRSQTSMVHAPSIVGRHYEKDALVHKLLGGESCDQNFSIVPIVGMGGVGKTTLARLLYDEKKVNDHFELKAWACVSDDFDSFAICKVIFQSVTGENKDFADLNLLQEALKDYLRGKIFLLVLDDVWSESYEDWETLVGPFHACAPGSKIVITTRNDHLLRMLRCKNLNQLDGLTPEDALSLIALEAFGVTNFNSHISLKPYALGIVKKCGGLPLALKALGRLLSTKNNNEDSWKNVLDSEIWNLAVEGQIIPALKLSYHDLSACLKQLFAYCSLFPKDFLFDKEKLVLLWMGEGFLHQSHTRDSTQEIMGLVYFEELLSRSFFQRAPNNESLFVMHDMMNDLAKNVASEFFVRSDTEERNDIGREMVEKYRHFSFVREKYVTYKKFGKCKGATCLRTFLATSAGVVKSWRQFYLPNKVVADLLYELPMLRVLCLSDFEIKEVPAAIGTLRHLRYLNLSRTKITHFPENVCNLYNLQTLLVAGCHSLAKFPNSFLQLKNLRHLDIRDTPCLEQMPLGIGELKNLRTLSKIIIGGEGKFEISKLKELENLCGKVSIVGLEKVKNAFDARKANFSQKRLSELEARWSDGLDVSRNEMLEKDVLNELKPCTNKLTKLTIVSYGGLEFPNWVADSLFLRLKHVSIRDCERCTSLPSLGQLPLLKNLFIEGLNGLKVVGLELLGTGGAFPSLEILSFRNMRGWEKWFTNNGVVFPCLRQLSIDNCPNLVEVTLEALPSLNVLVIRKCNIGVLRRLVQVAPSVTNLKVRDISGTNDMLWRGVIEYLEAVEYLTIENSEVKYLWESKASVSNLLTSLRILNVYNCKNLEHCICPAGIEKLTISNCTSVTTISLPTGGKNLKSLRIWGCKHLLEREWGGQNMNSRSLPMLEFLSIIDWRNLNSITELNYLVHLKTLILFGCESLESFPDNELPGLASLKHLGITNCPSMDASFPRGFWPPKLQSLRIGKLKKPMSDWGQQNFPNSLVKLYLDGDDGVSTWSQFSHFLPSYLTSVHIIEFEKLKSVSMELLHLTSLQSLSFYNCSNLSKLSHDSHPEHLTSLQHLFFEDCPNLMDLPEELFPSLLSLRIQKNCPELEERCSERGTYWPLIRHIPCIEIVPDFE